jgi:outer membrane protein TolC
MMRRSTQLARSSTLAAALAAVAGVAQERTQRDQSLEAMRQRLADIPIPSDHQGREVLELSLADALRLGRRNNLDLRAEELVPYQRAEELRIEEAFFEPEFFGAVATGRSVSPRLNTFQPEIARESTSGTVGFRGRVVTGGSFELAFAPARLRQTTTTPGFPERQFTSEISAVVTQPLLRGAWTDYALRNVDVAQAQYAASRFRFERQVQDKLLEIVRAYWELAFSRQDYRVVFMALDLAREQLRITNERIRVRDLAERDRVSDEAEVARRREELIRAENAIRQREDDLRRLLFEDRDGSIWQRNLRPSSQFADSTPLPQESWQDLALRALRNRPDLIALRADIRIAEVQLRTAERDLLPQLDLVGGYSTDGASTTFPPAWEDTLSLEFPDWSIELQLSVPIGNSAARANRDRAELGLERSRRLIYAAELDVEQEVRDALRQLQTLAESIRASEESVRLAETTLDTARETLNVGRGTIFEVQERNQDLLDARQRLLRNLLDYRVAEAQLQHALGVLEAPIESGDAESADRPPR